MSDTDSVVLLVLANESDGNGMGKEEINCDECFSNGSECDQVEGSLPVSTGKVAEKRMRSDSDEQHSPDDDGFTTVMRKPKKVPRRIPTDHGPENQKDSMPTNEICVISKDILPKQMAFAKLLRAENIKDILRIKYKGPYKVLVQFERKEEADKLVKMKSYSLWDLDAN